MVKEEEEVEVGEEVDNYMLQEMAEKEKMTEAGAEELAKMVEEVVAMTKVTAKSKLVMV